MYKNTILFYTEEGRGVRIEVGDILVLLVV
jgi:hypothetical protein